MKYLKIFLLAVLALLIVGLYSCEEDSLIADDELMFQEAQERAKPVRNCFNLRIQEEDIELGCACISSPYDCPVTVRDQCNFGIMSFPMTLGEHEGIMRCIMTWSNQDQGTILTGGSIKMKLCHQFVKNNGSAFWTEDQAVCSPGTDPTCCNMRDAIRIIGGCGDFEGITGKLQMKGVLRFFGRELCPVFYLDGEEVFVPKGLTTFKLSGKVCIPPDAPI